MNLLTTWLSLLTVLSAVYCKQPKKWNGKIAFSRVMKNGNVELFNMLPNGRDVNQLTFSYGSNSSATVVNTHPFYSSNGKYIAFTSTRTKIPNIFIMKSEGTEVRQVTNGNGSSEVPSFSPDGKTIAFSGTRNGSSFEIFTISVDGTNLKQLTFTNSTNDGPKFTPDGKYIVFSSDMNGCGTPRNRDIYIMDALTGKNVRRITYGMDNRFSRSISPDGKKIVFSSTKNNVGNLYIVNINGKGLKKITNSPGNGTGFSPLPGWPVFNGAITPVWSPDGTCIAYADNSEGNYSVYKLILCRGKVTRLIFSGNDISLGWQPIILK